jgi:hypothetical protein
VNINQPKRHSSRNDEGAIDNRVLTNLTCLPAH